MANLIIFISNNLPTKQIPLTSFIKLFSTTMILLHLLSTIVFCYVMKSEHDKLDICLYSVVVTILLISTVFIIRKAIKYLSDSQNVLNTLSDNKQMNYNTCLLDMSKLKWYLAWLCIFTIAIIISFDYTIIIPILLAALVTIIICMLISGIE